MSTLALLRRPTAFLPIAMSMAALALVIWFVVTHGVARQVDENGPAHLFQLLLAAQLPVVAWFAVRWLPQQPRPASLVMGLQFVAALSALAPVFVLGF